MIKAGIAMVALALAAPLAAQAVGDAPPPPGGMEMRGPGGWGKGRPFAGLSEPGRRALMAAMRPDERDRADHERVRAARDRALAIMSADRLDVPALRRAMDDEREIASKLHERRQAAMVQALQGLTLADRRAFVDDARKMRGHFEGGMMKRRPMIHGHGGMDDGPPGPPPM